MDRSPGRGSSLLWNAASDVARGAEEADGSRWRPQEVPADRERIHQQPEHKVRGGSRLLCAGRREVCNSRLVSAVLQEEVVLAYFRSRTEVSPWALQISDW